MSTPGGGGSAAAAAVPRRLSELGEEQEGATANEATDPTGTPEEELDGFVKSGTEAAAGLEGQWVTQVSAKKVGLEADGKTPANYAYNVEVTRRSVEMAHACGVSVEGELGCLGSLETGKWADFLVLGTNPLDDIANTHSLETVYIAGNAVPGV